jgi:hypothetical protein
MAVTINGTTGIAGVDGSASTPAVQGTDTNTGIFFPAADTIAFGEGGAEAMRIDSSGNVGIGTNSPATRVEIRKDSATSLSAYSDALRLTNGLNYGYGVGLDFAQPPSTGASIAVTGAISNDYDSDNNYSTRFYTMGSGTLAERARITSGGEACFGTTATILRTQSGGSGGVVLNAGGLGISDFARSSSTVIAVNLLSVDGTLIDFRQDATSEGTISVSGTTVSYNGGHLSRWAQMPGTKDDTLVKGTVMSNLDEMNVYTDAEGNPVDNEQLNKVKVSDVEGDVNVAGVFVNWTYDDAHQVDEINMAMTGDMIIRIAQGVVVQKGDLLMSAGDGTAKPQDDDIVRSKTVAKVTSNHVTCTYADGSYCVPCVLMAC